MLTVKELKEKGNMKLLCPEAVPDREVTGCYCGDLLSWVMFNDTKILAQKSAI